MTDTKKKKGLSSFNIDNNWKVVIDPDNVFWGIILSKSISAPLLPGEVASLYKKVKTKLNKEMKDFRFGSNLSAVYVNPTDRCNANCSYCYIPPAIRKNGNQMNKEQLNLVMEKIDNHFKNSSKRPVVVFHASEPLLVKDIIFEAMDKFKKQFYFGLQTNALLLEETDVGFLKNHRVGVGISLDSLDPDINDRQRPYKKGNGNFAKAVEAIEWFNGYEGLNVITTITKHNVMQLPDLVEFLHTKKVGCVLLNPVRVTQKTALKLKPDQKVLTKYFINAVEKAMELSKNSRHIITIANFANIILGIIAPTGRRLMCDISPCGGGRCFLCITAKGDMIPCGEFISLNGFSGGNIFDTTIAHAMRSEPFKKIRSRIIENISECKVCDFRNICGSPCPAELYSLGNMNQPSVFCKFYEEIIKYAFKLIAEDKVKYLFRKKSLEHFEYAYKLK
ncbi:MAG: peptide-modifying radical SAM enzyme CbpB [Nitrospirae bacterium CG_4_10_14_0_8_um_filter_41_23]|nr:peptide-modifying radical SAM enzyme CbpB [Nitrospirota bacterium]OIP60864.1 MAG: peptide-modifying radical SAM enzyme CbpB [Nitrospirae bacterium CG2_30_41_42]PIQ94677.1 MAG: peptide-modifying radical SAM enzyme CbpB [Nitrospirae bacterium CG11_big_fil_rev_8_21_14_0_20_41_14]PIV42509.1 MAG: peptide-modifying radical SAM enzyme CbpB [Nitrospirae bacterium CG02_land_8_20_14_3_00_41_53]PIW87970.1 MAG: peptide-modifying radical SAM enzyme CbpB [Nitrospirae bacterium CG_4_8_14_3_um_filter_41_47]